MSHFVVNVIIPRTLCPEKEDITEEIIEEMMYPFSEHIEVDAYEEECYCIGLRARIEAREQAVEYAGKDLNAYRKEYHDLPEDGRPSWVKFIEPLVEAEKMLYDNHKQKGAANADCDSCMGSGIRETTYNPDSKWDWYVCGGRWHGWLTGVETNEDPYRDNIVLNTVSTEENIISRKIPFATLTPDGEWYEQGTMLMFGQAANEQSDEDWEANYLKLLGDYPDCWVVAVDCHI